MPNAAYEKLQTLGFFGLSIAIRYEIITRRMGAGRRRSLLYGSRAGLLAWKLVFKVLPDTIDGQIEVSPTHIESRANYLWNFFCRSKTGYEDIDHPFIITCPRDGKGYYVVFSDNEISYEMFMTKLYSTGLQLEQVTIPGESLLPDASIGEAPPEGMPVI
ncbi:MAG TPA: hypothetical protein VGN95_19460 [Pyrinomonadaceae bacterium]|jgi:hypothetical protein|nr:hypothetical protein [Pyrinomonadaceae bacterium]